MSEYSELYFITHSPNASGELEFGVNKHGGVKFQGKIVKNLFTKSQLDELELDGTGKVSSLGSFGNEHLSVYHLSDSEVFMIDYCDRDYDIELKTGHNLEFTFNPTIDNMLEINSINVTAIVRELSESNRIGSFKCQDYVICDDNGQTNLYSNLPDQLAFMKSGEVFMIDWLRAIVESATDYLRDGTDFFVPESEINKCKRKHKTYVEFSVIGSELHLDFYSIVFHNLDSVPENYAINTWEEIQLPFITRTPCKVKGNVKHS